MPPRPGEQPGHSAGCGDYGEDGHWPPSGFSSGFRVLVGRVSQSVTGCVNP
jgi:hypothetical protein